MSTLNEDIGFDDQSNKAQDDLPTTDALTNSIFSLIKPVKHYATLHNVIKQK